MSGQLRGALFVAALFLTAPGHPAAAPAPVKILTLDWTSQVVVSHIFGDLLELLGYPVVYLSDTSDSQWFLLSSGQADLQVEVWEGTMGDKMAALSRRGLIIDAGNHDALTREEWWYPAYVKTLCPGLPDWRALKSCASLFADDGGARGRYYSGPWEKPDRARIRALDLPFDVVTLKDSDALRDVLEKALAKRTPVLLLNWTPNWVESVYDGEFVEFPEYAEVCERDPEWGVNQALTWDCGNPKDGWVKKAVSRDFAARGGCGYALVRAIRLTNEDISEAAALVEVHGLSHAAAARRWLDEHGSDWDAWMRAAPCGAEGAR